MVGVGSATYAPATLTVTSTTARTQISWQSFNVAANEVVRFVQPSAQSSVLNHLFSPQSLNILGGLSSNGSVLFMINGMVSGSGVNLDLAGVINTSLRLPRLALAASGVAPAAQPRPLATLADGRIYVISQDEQAVTTAGWDVVLNPGKTIELANASMPNLRVELTAPHAEAINLSRLVGNKGDSGIFAGLFRVPAAARQAAEQGVDAVLTASAEEHTPTTPDVERFYRYALLYAWLRSEAPQDEGGMMKVAAAASARMVLPAAKSRPSLLPQAIEIGAPAQRSREAAVALSSLPVPAPPEPVPTLEPQPIPAAGENESERNRVALFALAPALPAVEVVATLEPQPIPAAGENESERNRVALFALAPALAAVEVVATLEPQPIPAAGENESERNRVALFALAPALPAVEIVATLEPQPILLRQPLEPEDIRTLVGSQLAAAQSPVQPRLAQASDLEGEHGRGRGERKAGPAVIVVALAQHSATPAPQEDSNVKEVRIERRAPRYFTDYRGALFFM
ncbi:MAG: filamentous hemagglutinin N-terminal domain-containing protein [Betaproteobacteria bacterium]|nr:filamentous hemagglutinin N-terminal domain-containing protein [Betaproteobacteria bacterium]